MEHSEDDATPKLRRWRPDRQLFPPPARPSTGLLLTRRGPRGPHASTVSSDDQSLPPRGRRPILIRTAAAINNDNSPGRRPDSQRCTTSGSRGRARFARVAASDSLAGSLGTRMTTAGRRFPKWHVRTRGRHLCGVRWPVIGTREVLRGYGSTTSRRVGRAEMDFHTGAGGPRHGHGRVEWSWKGTGRSATLEDRRRS